MPLKINEESAESIVVVSESVSSRIASGVAYDEEYGQPIRSKARTVNGQFDPQAGLSLNGTDPCRELSDVCVGKHGTAEDDILCYRNR